MASLIYFFLGLIIGVVLVLIFRRGKEIVEKKEENKKKIIELFEGRAGLSNSDIRESFGLSDRSVVRYMDELEKEGKVEQVGDIGRNVVYRLKNH